MTPSRLPLDPTTNLPTIRSSGELNQFLRGSHADAQGELISEGMRQLAERIERIVATLRVTRQRTIVAPMLVELLTVLRGHRQRVARLGLPWRGLYEYGGYLQALTTWRTLIGRWLVAGGPRSAQLPLTAEDFELVAWRTLAEGMLLIDMHEQWRAGQMQAETRPAELREPAPQGAARWWHRLRR